jgi:hypothetical protein
MGYFKDGDFRYMRYKVYRAKDYAATGLDTVMAMRRITQRNRMKVGAYFAYMYDANSPVPRRVQDLKERKAVAAKLAGFDLTQAEEYNLVSQIFGLSAEVYVDIATEMLRAQHNRDFSRISALEKFFDECVEKMFAIVEEGDKMDAKKVLDAMTVKDGLRKYMKATSEELEGLYAKIYGGDKQLEELVGQKMSYSPELVAGLTEAEDYDAKEFEW